MMNLRSHSRKNGNANGINDPGSSIFPNQRLNNTRPYVLGGNGQSFDNYQQQISVNNIHRQNGNVQPNLSVHNTCTQLVRQS